MMAGVLDYYVWRGCSGNGIPCVRSWPRYTASHYPSTLQPARDALAYLMSHIDEIPESVRQALRDMSAQTGLNWRDWLVRVYMNASTV